MENQKCKVTMFASISDPFLRENKKSQKKKCIISKIMKIIYIFPEPFPKRTKYPTKSVGNAL